MVFWHHDSDCSIFDCVFGLQASFSLLGFICSTNLQPEPVFAALSPLECQDGCLFSTRKASFVTIVGTIRTILVQPFDDHLDALEYCIRAVITTQ